MARSLRTLSVLALLLGSASSSACAAFASQGAVSVKLHRTTATPRDASVFIDEQYLGDLAYVQARGVRIPVGKHRVSVTREGYFPWDRLIEADRTDLLLDVELTPIPD